MRIRTLFLGVSFAGLVVSAPALALEPMATVPDHDAPLSARTLTASGAPQQLTGARINRFVRVETETHERATADFSEGMRKDFERDRRPAAYGVAYMPVSPKAEVFARIGYGGSKSSFSGPREDSWKYGAGARYKMNSRNGVRADYIRQGVPRSDVKADIVSLGFVRRF